MKSAPARENAKPAGAPARAETPMRPAFALCALLALAFTSAPALAHDTHGPCPGSRTLLNGALVHVDLYGPGCVGATVTIPRAACAFGEIHLFSGIHTPVLSGDGCETGVVIETLELLP